MSPEEIRFAWSLVPGFGFGVVVAGLVVYLLAKYFMPGYLAQKGKNLADKEDIAALTREVEEVKRQHAEVLEAVKFRNQLRMAGIDRRLQAHQEAFTHLRELVKYSHGPEVGKQVLACQEWWERNCLYLEPEARQSFSNAYLAASVHQTMLRSHGGTMTDEQATLALEQWQANWSRITDALNKMLTAVALPVLTEAESTALKSVGQNS